MKVNTYGVKMNGLKKAASETKNLHGYYGGGYLQVNYDKATGDIFTDYFYSLGKNSWAQYHDDDVITIGNVCNPTTMQQIADMVARALGVITAECAY